MKLYILILLLVCSMLFSCYSKQEIEFSLDSLTTLLVEYRIKEALDYIDIYESTLNDKQLQFEVYSIKADLLFVDKQFSKCIEYCDKALKHNKIKYLSQSILDYPLYLKGIAYIKIDRLDLAELMYEEINSSENIFRTDNLSLRIKYNLLLGSSQQNVENDLKNLRYENPHIISASLIEAYYINFKSKKYRKAITLIEDQLSNLEHLIPEKRSRSNFNFYLAQLILVESLCYFKLGEMESSILSMKSALNIYDIENDINNLLLFLEFDTTEIQVLHDLYDKSIQ